MAFDRFSGTRAMLGDVHVVTKPKRMVRGVMLHFKNVCFPTKKIALVSLDSGFAVGIVPVHLTPSYRVIGM